MLSGFYRFAISRGHAEASPLPQALPKLPPAEYEDRLRETFLKIVPQYFESAATVGVALTGGLDTRMLMAGRPPEMCNQTCYTFTGPTGRTLLPLAVGPAVSPRL